MVPTAGALSMMAAATLTHPQNEELDQISGDGPDECPEQNVDHGGGFGPGKQLNVLPGVGQFVVGVETAEVGKHGGIDVGVLRHHPAHPRSHRAHFEEGEKVEESW